MSSFLWARDDGFPGDGLEDGNGGTPLVLGAHEGNASVRGRLLVDDLEEAIR